MVNFVAIKSFIALSRSVNLLVEVLLDILDA